MLLRPYQQDALRISKERYDVGVRRQLIQLPTGTGKTPVFASLKNHHKFDNRMMVVVHREELAEQAADKIRIWNPTFRVGIEMGERECSSSDDVVVASVQTLGNLKRLSKFVPRQFDAVVPDEAHHAVAPSWKKVFEHFGLLDLGETRATHRGLLLGVTATPNRGDGQGLGQVFDEIIYRMSILDAIRDGWLVDVRGFNVRTDCDLSNVQVRAGDFSVGQLEDAVNTDYRNHLIVQNWLSRGEGRQTVAFCVDIAHAKRLADTFKAYGVAAEALWGADPDRAEKLKYHKAKKLQVLTNCGVLTEGYDDWQIGCIIMARPTKSQLLFVQMAGRGTRIQDDIPNLNEAREKGLTIKKNDCILIDVVDNTGKHSLVTLASLFGLGDKTDLSGNTITRVKAKVDEAKAKYPSIDLTQVQSVDDIQAQVEKVDLFQVKWEPEVVENSKNQWKKTIGGDYIIHLPNKESVLLYQDLLDKWNVKGTVCGNSFELIGLNDLQEAFKQGDNFLQMYGREYLNLIRREAKWHKKKISLAQKNFIKRLYKYEPKILAHIDNISSGEAQALIDRKINSLGAPAKVGA